VTSVGQNNKNAAGNRKCEPHALGPVGASPGRGHRVKPPGSGARAGPGAEAPGRRAPRPPPARDEAGLTCWPKTPEKFDEDRATLPGLAGARGKPAQKCPEGPAAGPNHGGRAAGGAPQESGHAATRTGGPASRQAHKRQTRARQNMPAAAQRPPRPRRAATAQAPAGPRALPGQGYMSAVWHARQALPQTHSRSRGRLKAQRRRRHRRPRRPAARRAKRVAELGKVYHKPVLRRIPAHEGVVRRHMRRPGREAQRAKLAQAGAKQRSRDPAGDGHSRRRPA